MKESEQVEAIYKKIEEALNKIPGKVSFKIGFPMSTGVRPDFFVQTKDGKNFVVEVKIGAKEGYLPFSAWGQLAMYRKVLQEWHNLSNVIPVIITNQIPSHDLAEALNKSGIAVVMIGNTSEETLRNLKESLQKLDQWPEDEGH